MLLYIHVPFCRTRCNYCAFYSNSIGSSSSTAAIINAYGKTLLAEIALWGTRLGKAPIESVFFGGGTPSLLPTALLNKIMNAISKTFSMAPGAEVSLEANPESLLAFGYAEDLRKVGINRLSIGIQSLNDNHLNLLGRPHNAREAIAAYDTARVCGFKNINLDLMWGLPEQRVSQWMEQLKQVVNMQPEHLSCYGLSLEDGTALEHRWKAGELILPAEEEQSAMYLYGVEYLAAQGFLHYEISNFSRMGYMCRHNLGYWEGADYLGLGPSAVSTLGALRWSNPPDLPEWSERVKSGECGKDPEKMDLNTRTLEMIMLRLRTERGLQLKTYKELTGRDFLKDNKRLIEALHQKGFVKLRNGYLSLSTEGMLVSNSILEYLFAVTSV